VLELDKYNTHALHNRGISFDNMGLYHKAVEDLTEAVRLDPVRRRMHALVFCSTVGVLDSSG